MRRRTIGLPAAIITGAALLSVFVSAPAGASGGGCYGPVTGGHGVTVAIKSACFTPTIIHVKPGEDVTWVNHDPFAHTVTGVNQGWGDSTSLKHGDTITVSFSRPGVYPYFCYYHIGMVGTVVVGNGNGPGAADVRGVTVRPVVVSPSPAPPEVVAGAQPVAVAEASRAAVPSHGAFGAWWIVGTFAGIATAGAGLATRARAHRRSR